MTTTTRQFLARQAAIVVNGLMVIVGLAAAQPVRIKEPLDTSVLKTLVGNRTPKARLEDAQGPLDPSAAISGITLIFRSSPSQAGDLEQLLEQQRDPASPNYHKWLTPEQYADRFGLSGNDIREVTAWLESEGFHIDSVARGRTSIMFNGSAGQVEKAFHTEIQRYSVEGRPHYANVTDPSIPAALASVVWLIRGLDDFHTEPRRLHVIPVADFTSGGGHSLVPGDLATIYDIAPLYQNGITGTGQKIAVVGQTDIHLSDIAHFRSLYGLPANNPQPVLAAGSQDPGISANDLLESSLDLEYAGAIAPSAAILFVYSTDVWTSIEYAVDQALAPVITTSYGYCEPQISNVPASTAAYFQSVAQKANSMGITWLASSGDTGAADCDTTSEQVAEQGLAVDLPASVPDVTAVGGTEFMEGSGNYWASTNNSNGSSALSYIPEMAWNDTASAGVLLATGGGASIFFSKPSWQSGAGVPNDNARDVPDVSFTAAVYHDPYRIYVNGQTSYVGGTSAPTPMFSGVLALLNQYLVSSGSQSQPGLGNINPALYRLAQSTPAIFHDVTVGSNIVPCASGSPNCTNGELGYNAGAGYDRTTGLGSMDVYKLVTLWNGSQPVATTTAVGASATNIGSGGYTVLTATVSAASGASAPSGSVTFTRGQTVLGTVALSASGAAATAALEVNGSQLSAGANAITATYAGNSSFIGSSAAISITVINATVATVSVTPNSGNAASQTFALQYSDTAGAASFQQAYVWFAAPGAAESNSCMLYYNVAANQINLLNNSATAWQPATPGAATTLQNSQCSVAVASSSVTLSGNTLTLDLAVTFQATYAGSKNIYLYAVDVSGTNSGWQQLGTWTQPGASTVTAISVTPSSGSGASQTFALAYSDTAGAASLQQVWVWFAAPGAAESNSCMLYYNVAANQINLLNNGATAWQPATPGAATSLQNSQCSVAVASSSVTQSGNTLTLNLAMTFQAAYAGAKNIYLYAVDGSGTNSGWQQLGTWAQPSGSTVTAALATPNSGSGASQTFALQYSDTAGAGSLQQAYVWFATPGAGESNSCMLYYNVAANQINLLNDSATAWQAATPGAATSLQNSQCSVAVASSSVTPSGNTLTLNLALTFQAAYAGEKNIYLYAVDVSGANSGWQQPGTWTP